MMNVARLSGLSGLIGGVALALVACTNTPDKVNTQMLNKEGRGDLVTRCGGRSACLQDSVDRLVAHQAQMDFCDFLSDAGPNASLTPAQTLAAKRDFFSNALTSLTKAATGAKKVTPQQLTEKVTRFMGKQKCYITFVERAPVSVLEKKGKGMLARAF